MSAVREQVSALADGHLRADEFAPVIGRVGADEELRAAWQTYHLVGDVLRSGVHVPCTDAASFLSRLQNRLAAEPAPAPAVVAALDVPPQPVSRQRAEAANEPLFRWKLVAGAASLAAVAAIGWNWVNVESNRADGAQLARQQANPAPAIVQASVTQPVVPVVVALPVSGGDDSQIMLRDSRLDQFLEAHRQVGGASQLPSGFLRNATFQGPAR
jgi:sigma-E factor negative regulatory protein RseA